MKNSRGLFATGLFFLSLFMGACSGDTFETLVDGKDLPRDPAIVFSKSSLSIDEGSFDTYDIHLNSKPTENVTVNLSSVLTSDGVTEFSQINPEPAELTFTPENWDTDQSVTLTTSDNATDDFTGNILLVDVLHAATSADEDYSTLPDAILPLNYIDNDIFQISAVSAGTPSGGNTVGDTTYLNYGDTVDLTITFSEAVTIPNGSSIEVTLDTGEVITLSGPVASVTEITAPYVVSAGTDSSGTLSVTAVNVGDGVENSNGVSIDATAIVGADIGGTKIVIDNTVPTVVVINSTTVNGYYNTGNVDISLYFSENVFLTGGNLEITLNSGAPVVTVSAIDNASSASAIYAIGAGENNAALDADSLALSAGTLQDAAGNDADLSVPTGANIADFKTIVIDTQNPTDNTSNLQFTSATDTDGNDLEVSWVAFSDNIGVVDHRLKTYTDSACTTGESDHGLTGSATASDNSIIDGLPIGTYYATVTAYDATGNFTTSACSTDSISVLDTEPPVDNTTDLQFVQNYDTDGSDVEVSWTAFSDNIGVTDHRLKTYTDSACTLGETDHGLTGSATAADSSIVDGLADGTYYATVTAYDGAGNSVTSACSTDSILVDATVPVVTSVTVPAAGNYKAGDNLDFTVYFSENITVTNLTSTLDLTIGSAAVSATQTSAGADNISYRYTVQSGENDSDGISVDSLVLNTTTIDDVAGNSADTTLNSVGSTASVLVDTTAPVVSIGSPSIYYANSSATVTYPITYSGADSIALDAADVIVGATGSAACSVAVSNGATATPTVTLTSCTGDGVVDISIAAAQSSDLAGNTDAGDGPSTVFNVDNTLPVISSVAPASSTSTNKTTVSYTFSEICYTGSVSWIHAGGTTDTDHVQSLTGGELSAGAHSNITITNNPVLVIGATYDISFNCTDLAGNVANEVTSTGVDFLPLIPQSAETIDTDANGKIDTYRITFNKSVDDSTFPGYIADSEGTVTSSWLVSGRTNVRLAHGSVVSWETDTVDDNVIYLKFNETTSTCDSGDQSGCDTGAKPDLTTGASPGLLDIDLNTMSSIGTTTITEADTAQPILVSAKSLGPDSVDAIFSEQVEQSSAETSGNYALDGGLSVTAAARDGSDYKTVHLTTSSQTGGMTYTLTVAGVKDMANLGVNSTANTASFDGLVKPVVVSIAPASSGTLTITFNESIVASTAECSSLSACAVIYENASLPVKTAVSTAGTGNDSSQFTLTVNDMVEGQLYTTKVLSGTAESVASGQLIGSTNNSATFTGDGRPGVVISGDTTTECGLNAAKRVVVQYDQAVSATATTLTNYKITQCESGSCTTGLAGGNESGASAVTDEGSNKYSIDFAEAFNTSGDAYRLNISGVMDANGNAVETPTNLSFQCGNDTTAPVLISADVISSNGTATQVMLTFSEEVEQVTANTTSNYQYDSAGYGTNVSSAAKQSNPSQVLVAFVPNLADGGHQISVKGVTDIAQRTISGTVTVSSGSANVLGSATAFTTEMSTGARITVNGETHTVSTISSDTSLDVADTWTINSSGQTAKVTNVIIANGTNNAQPIIVQAPTNFDGGSVFTDPFGDGTAAGHMVKYDGKLYIGADSSSAKIFETDYGLTTSRTITLDADGTAGAPIEAFYDYPAYYSGCSDGYACDVPIKGVDTLYAACVGGTSTPVMTGTACTGAGGIEKMFIGALNSAAIYRSFWETSDKSSITTTFTFAEKENPDSTTGTQAYRSTAFVLFKDQLWSHFGAEGGGGGRGGRVCVNTSGCDDGLGYEGAQALSGVSRISRIGVSGVGVKNGSQTNAMGNGRYLSAINILYEHDADAVSGNNDCSGSTDCESQLYMANGGVYKSSYTPALGNARTGTYSDGGIVRTSLKYSARSSLPNDCASGGCMATDDYDTTTGHFWVDVTPDTNVKWNSFVSIPYPENSTVTGAANCSTSGVEMDCVEPYNIFIPATKAIPYMKTAPNGDLYILRNACSSQDVCINGSGTCNFRTAKQVCPPGSEVPQLWMLPSCESSVSCPAAADEWVLVAEYSGTGKTNMNGNDSIGANNTHATLLEFVGDYIYIGFDNATDGSNIWRADMSSMASGTTPAESDFSIVNIAGLDGTTSNQKIFSHITVTDSGTEWLILTTRDGSSAMQLYRTSNP